MVTEGEEKSKDKNSILERGVVCVSAVCLCIYVSVYLFIESKMEVRDVTRATEVLHIVTIENLIVTLPGKAILTTYNDLIIR